MRAKRRFTMYLSKHSNGTYYVYYEDSKGKRRSKTTGTKYKKEAEKFFIYYRKKIEAESLLDVIPITLKKFTFDYLVRCEPYFSWKTTLVYKSTFKLLLNHFGDIQLTDLTTRRLEDYILHRAIKVSIYAARKDLICISACLNKAVKDGYLLKSPATGIKRIKLPEIQPSFFSKEEYEKLLFAMDDNEDMKDLTIFAINTGFRSGELISLTWNQINLENKTAILNNQSFLTKSKKVRSMPLNPDAYEILEKRLSKRAEGSDRVFTMFGKPLNPNTLSQNFKKYVYKSKVNSKLHFHSLRHSFASFLVQSGVSIYVVSNLMGHADIKTTQIYAHLRTDDMILAVNKITRTRIITEVARIDS